MFNCAICKKSKVSDKGFRLFISRNVVNIIKDEADDMILEGACQQQRRICDKCLKRKGENLEIDLD